MPVADFERRQEQIYRISPTRPLLPVATECLKYNQEDRPLIHQLCEQLALLKLKLLMISTQRASSAIKRAAHQWEMVLLTETGRYENCSNKLKRRIMLLINCTEPAIVT